MNSTNVTQSQSYQISANFDNEKETIRKKYCLVCFSTRFVGNAIHKFFQKLIDKQTEYELIIPNFLFSESKKFMFNFYFI